MSPWIPLLARRALAGLCLLTLLVPATAQTGGVGRVTVHLPRDARLFVDEVYCPLPGPARTFDTPPLDANRKYYYTLTVEISQDGRPVRVSRRAIIESGKTTQVDFGDRAAIIAAATLQQEKPEKQPTKLPEKRPDVTSDATPDLPNRPPPTQVLATLKDGNLSMIVPVFVWEEKKMPYTVEKEGKPTTAYKTIKVAIPKLATRQVSLRDAKVIDVSGKTVPSEKLVRLLEKERPVMLTEQDRVDPFYLSTLKQDTLIVLVPPEAPKTDVVIEPVPVKPPDKGSPDTGPQGAPPLLVQAVLEGKLIVAEMMVTEVHPNPEGPPKKVERKVQMKIDGEKALLFTAGGKKLMAGDLKRFLSDKATAILVSSDSLPVHGFHLQSLYDPETLVVVPPPQPPQIKKIIE